MKLSPSENGYFTGGDNFSTSDSQSSASDALNHNHIPQNHPNPNHHPNHQQQSSGYPMMNLDEFLEQTSFSGDSPASTSTSGGSVQTESSSLQNIDFSMSDLALAGNSNGYHHHFDPSNVHLNAEHLKPQPIVTKSRKTLVPDTLKDSRYWARRAKNNVAAKRSREARRLKENQIVLRASYLEKENQSLRDAVEKLTQENQRLKEMFNN